MMSIELPPRRDKSGLAATESISPLNEPHKPPRSSGGIVNSVWWALLVSIVAGTFYAALVMGPGRIKPTYVSWVFADPAQQYIAWELYRQDPNWHWPLTYTNRVGYPYGESVALMDVNPMFAIPLKVCSRWLPDKFQYFGIETLTSSTLQFFLGLLLFRFLLGPSIPSILLCSSFLLLSPVMTDRMRGHYSLTNHWLLLSAILLYLVWNRSDKPARFTFAFVAVALAATAVCVHPYIAFPVLVLIAGCLVSLVWRRKLTLWQGSVVFWGLVVICLATAYAVGLIMPGGGHGYGAGGYRFYSLNLLGPFDPSAYGSVLLKPLPHATSGQPEGYAYLGAGILVLVVLSIPLVAYGWKRVPRFSRQSVTVLFTCCVFLTLMALSTRITLGSTTILDLDPHEKLSSYFAVLRASGRLFWAPYYIISLIVLSLPFWVLPKRWSFAIVGCALALQFVDTQPLRRSIGPFISKRSTDPLKSPVWTGLGSSFKNLIVLPAWQCDGAASPGGPEGYRTFGFFAVSHHMRTNSYYPGRLSDRLRELHCGDALSNAITEPLSPDSLYVVTAFVGGEIAGAHKGPGTCSRLDGFVVCSSRSLPDVPADSSIEAKPVDNALKNAGFEGPDVLPWVPYQSTVPTMDDHHSHSGIQSLAETGGEGSVYQDITGLTPGKTYAVSAWVMGSPGATSTAQIAVYDPGSVLATFSTAVQLFPGWQLLSVSNHESSSGILRVHLFRNKGTGTIHWDDVRVEQVDKQGDLLAYQSLQLHPTQSQRIRNH